MTTTICCWIAWFTAGLLCEAAIQAEAADLDAVWLHLRRAQAFYAAA